MLKEGSRFVHVRGVGKSPARLAGELRAGDMISRHHEPHGYKVVDVKEASPHFVEVTEKHLKSGKTKKSKMKKTRLLAIKRIQESEEVLNLQTLRDKLEANITQLFPNSYAAVKYSTNLGESVSIHFTLEPKEDWKRGIFHNAKYLIIMIHMPHSLGGIEAQWDRIDQNRSANTVEVLSTGLDRTLFKKLNFFKKKGTLQQLLDYITKKFTILRDLTSLEETTSTMSLPITSTKPVQMKKKDEDKESEFGKAYKGVVEASHPKSRRLYDFLEKNKENRHTWGPDGFCTSCKTTHRTDLNRQNDLCPALMKKGKVKESLYSPVSPLIEYPELEDEMEPYRVEESRILGESFNHGDIVRLTGYLKRPGYFRIDAQNAVGASLERPWVGRLNDNAGFYLNPSDTDDVEVVLSSNDHDTDSIKSDNEVEAFANELDIDESLYSPTSPLRDSGGIMELLESMVPFSELSKEDQDLARRAYVYRAGKYGARYDFKDEDYLYPVDQRGRLLSGGGRKTDRQLAISRQELDDPEAMKKRGYEDLWGGRTKRG